jgi:phage tail-like protein
MTNDQQVSGYLECLPAIFRQDAFLGRFLLAFEKTLGELEKQLDGIHQTFDPEKTPAEFLEWLSGWVALSLRADLNDERRRDFIAEAVPLYRLRGTKPGLERLIQIYTALPPVIHELNTPFQIGVPSTLGVDTMLDRGAPHFFKVTIRLGAPNPDERKRMVEVARAIIDGEKPAHTHYPEERKRMVEVARAIIDSEKPAHTHYVLEVETPILQIGEHSTLGVDTLLGPQASRRSD